MIPYSFSDTLTLPQAEVTSIGRDTYSGVHLSIQPGNVEVILHRIEAWFEERDEVILVDVGMSSKSGYGYIVLEWEACEIDALFLKILDHEEVIADYSVYVRSEEV